MFIRHQLTAYWVNDEHAIRYECPLPLTLEERDLYHLTIYGA